MQLLLNMYNMLVQGAKFTYVSNCALSSVWKFYPLIVYLSLMLCFFLWHLDVEKLRYRAKSHSTFVVSVEKWASIKQWTSSFVLNIYRNSSNDGKKFMATIVYPVAALTSGLNVFKRDGRLWKTINVRASQENVMLTLMLFKRLRPPYSTPYRRMT